MRKVQAGSCPACIDEEGFFEWRKEDGRNEKYLVTLKDGSLFSMAGIYSQYKDSRLTTN